MPFSSWFTRKSKPISPATQPSPAVQPSPATPEQDVEPDLTSLDSDEDSDTSWLDAPLNESEENDRRIRIMGEKISKINMNYHGKCTDFSSKIPEWCRAYGKFDRGMRNEKLALLIFQQVFSDKLYTVESFNAVNGPKIEKNIRMLNETDKNTLEKFLDNLLSTSGGGKRKTKKRKISKKTIKNKNEKGRRRKSKRKRS